MAEPSILKDSDFETLLLKPEGFLIDYKMDVYPLGDKDNKAACIKLGSIILYSVKSN